jgi:hypothetical protein
MATHSFTPPVGHGHRDPVVVGARRLLQDGKSIVTVEAVNGDMVRWDNGNGGYGDTRMSIFARVTTPVDELGEAS